MATTAGRLNAFVLLFAGQSRYDKVSFGVFKMAGLLIAVKGKLFYYLENLLTFQNPRV